MFRPAMALAFTAATALGACGGGNDDGPATCDAPPDPEALCQDAVFFEALVSDLDTGQAAFDVVVGQRGAADVTTTSAPNGRAVLCLTAGDVEIAAEGAGFVARRDTLDSCALERAGAAGQPYPLGLMTPAFLDQELGGSSIERDSAATQLLVLVRRYPDGDPVEGAAVELDAEHEGPVERTGSLLLANVPGDQVTLSFTPPDGLDCAGPPAASLAAGGVAAVLFACE